jgi:transcriptional regulator with XRE-family HTH domain
MNTKPRSRRLPGSPPTHDHTKVKARRTELGLQQQELAHRLNISKTFMCEIESGIRSPAPELLERMAKELGTRVSEIEFSGCTCQCHRVVA